MTDLRAVWLRPPQELRGEYEWLITGAHSLAQAVELAQWDNTDLVHALDYKLAAFNDETNYQHLWGFALLGPEGAPESVIGHVSAAVDRADARLVEFDLLVHPEHRRQGIGTELLERLYAQPLIEGRTLFVNYQGQFTAADDRGEQVTAPTGTGSAPAATPGLLFATHHGYTFEQVERVSMLNLPVSPSTLSTFVAESQKKATGYTILTFHDTLPPEYVAGFADCMTSINADAPKGDLQLPDDPWDADRVERRLARFMATGFETLITVAINDASGEMAAMTLITWRTGEPFGYQQETVVVKHHRGRRLGLLIKARTLIELADIAPDLVRLYTWNAAENDFMLSINVALGFAPAGGNCAFQKLI